MAKLEWDGQRAAERIGKGAMRGISAAAISFQNDLKSMLSQPGRGRKYPRNPTTSSAPGEPPATQTGRLRRSIQVDLRRIRSWAARVGTNVRYAPFLELGTSRMRPRPYMRPTMRLMRGRLSRIVTSHVAAAVRGI